ncbi:MAG: chromosome segregation protein SMC [Paracoccaceae bacterium]|nr:chromosome segregation protein SMC [Paracoccaceae bacterium]
MRFTRLRLNGFKSFVDPTDLVIADGLTGVVGPNGCGKSNLLEALRWVMGETRPSAMRGGGMEDVIFAGAASRPARNFAEVTLTIDNARRLAPQGFNDADTLEIIRRITRDAGSAYKANAKDIRARDAQMLFADASTGAHSPALVRQGQIAELINARPKDRRRILEEAAGISGLYQRRHEAELKLKGAETNLARVEDVIEALAGQLTALARQAKAAARYREIGAALRRSEGILLYRRWREAEDTRIEAETALAGAVAAASEAERAARDAAARRAETEAALPPLREEEAVAAAILQKLLVRQGALADEGARATAEIERLGAALERLDSDIAREAGLDADARETIDRLTRETEALEAEGTGHDSRLAEAEAEAEAAKTVLAEREADLAARTEDVARLAARHQAVSRTVSDAETTLRKAETATAEAAGAAATAEADLATAETALAAAGEALAAAGATAEAAERALAEADTARNAAQAREAEGRAERSAAEGEVSALEAEVAALARLVERDTADGGQVMDVVRIAPGYEKALGAALADDLKAPVIDGEGASGWVALAGEVELPPLPGGVPALLDHADTPGVLERRLAQVGVVDGDAGAALQSSLLPGQRLVSVEGDLWRWDGFRTAAEDAPSTSALRLQQINRLEELKQDLARASARAEGAARAHTHLRSELDALTAADREAREARRAADLAATEAHRAESRAEADRNIAAGKLETSRLAETRYGAEAGTARAALAEAEAALADLPDLEAARAEAEDVRLTVEAARITMLARRSAFDEVRREGEARASRLEAIAAERRTWSTRLEKAGTRVAEIEARRAETAIARAEAEAAPARIEAEAAALATEIGSAEARKAEATDALVGAETADRSAREAERETERAASDAREARARAETRLEAAGEAVLAAAARIAEEQETTPDALLASLDVDPAQMPSAETAEVEVARLRRQRDALGAVNLRAEEDAREVQAEHDTLAGEREDLTAAIAELRAGIASLNKEGRERLLAAFDEVNRNFGRLFTHLFGGGEARLMLVESDDPLEAGLEIMCQPPGKKLSTLSLLSGGEQTLTALALIFAVFLANPAPICVLDEVDAPLDDANVGRFCDLLDEMTRSTDTRFLIITHHAVTMARMDRLFGVTMGEQGVSQLVSVDLKRAEAMVA